MTLPCVAVTISAQFQHRQSARIAIRGFGTYSLTPFQCTVRKAINSGTIVGDIHLHKCIDERLQIL
jgi:hypothetical protein